MPFALLIVGLALLVSAVNGQSANLFKLLKSDLPGYGIWVAAILVIGSLGYIEKAKPVSDALLVLVVLVLVLEEGQGSSGLFQKLQQGIQQFSGSGQTSQPTNGLPALPSLGTISSPISSIQ